MGRGICREGDGVHLNPSIPQARVLRRPSRLRFPAFQAFGPFRTENLNLREARHFQGEDQAASVAALAGLTTSVDEQPILRLPPGGGGGKTRGGGESAPGGGGRGRRGVKVTGETGPPAPNKADPP